MKRKIVKSKNEFIEWINLYNGIMNCYTTVYDFAEYFDNSKNDNTVILDRAFLDFDAHNEPLELAYQDLKDVVDFLRKDDVMFKMYFSGKGFHLFVCGEIANDIRSIQQYYTETFSHFDTLDRTGIQTNRLRRIPNSINLSSSDENGNPYFCIPLELEDLKQPLEYILNLAKSSRVVEKTTIGTKLVQWPEVVPIEISEIEIDIPESVGRLPLIPCLSHAIYVENPSHYARVYLIQWFRDLLSLGERELSDEKNREIVEIIMNELELISSKEDVWLDWDKSTTQRYVEGIVFKGYNAPSCKGVLIPNGYCVGKCWRYVE